MKKLTLFGSLLVLLQLAACAEGGGHLGDDCPPKAPCGNGVIDEANGETCDPGNGALNIPQALGGQTCQTMTSTPGQLLCTCGCQFDTSMCSAGTSNGGASGS